MIQPPSTAAVASARGVSLPPRAGRISPFAAVVGGFLNLPYKRFSLGTVPPYRFARMAGWRHCGANPLALLIRLCSFLPFAKKPTSAAACLIGVCALPTGQKLRLQAAAIFNFGWSLSCLIAGRIAIAFLLWRSCAYPWPGSTTPDLQGIIHSLSG